MLIPRLLFSVALILGPAAVLSAGQHETFLKTHCVDCHGPGAQEAGLRLDRLPGAFADSETFARWVRLFDRVDKGEMPPEDAEQPSDAERKAFLASLRGELVRADRARLAQHGHEAVRRLNRVEYEHTLQDLLALPLLRVKESLPEDGQQHGFDKVAGALDISHIQMRKYLEVADVALRKAIVRETQAPETNTWREPAADQWSARAAIATHNAAPLTGRELATGLTTHIRGNPRDDIGNTYRAASFQGEADSLVLFSGVLGAHQPEGLQIDRFQPAMGGWYRVRFSTWGLRWERTKAAPAVRGMIRKHVVFGEPYFQDEKGQWHFTALPEEKRTARESQENIEFYGDAEVTHAVRASLQGKVIGVFDAPSLKPTVHEFTTWLNPGEKLSFHVMTLPASGPANWGSSNGVVAYEGPGVAFDWFEVEGPIVDKWPPESQRRLFGETPLAADPPGIRSLLHGLAGRAFRRPVDAAEMDPYVAIVEDQLRRGTSFEDAMLAGYAALLCAPDFLFVGLEDGSTEQRSRSLKGTEDRGTQYALASRLSYFLWNSQPDDTLRELARGGELSHPRTLHAQVERMLDDPRSERFVEHFLDEWLELKKIDFTTPDPQLYPEFDPWLRDSMLTETRLYFRKMLDDDLSVGHLVDADFVLINQRLAELYGLRGVTGSQFKPVNLPKDSPRGGFLTQASVLKVTANGTATSPVLRGAWIVERLLGIPLDPPPPNIPAVEPDATGAVTIREMIEQHRADPSCASCHAKMDPPGMALESFDVLGGWRDRYRLSGQPKMIRIDGERVLEPHVEIIRSHGNRVRLRLGSEVDPSGELSESRPFQDVQGLKALLLNDREQLARNVVRQLLIYSTGSGIRFSDREEVEAIVAGLQHDGLRAIVHEVVQSEIFQRTGWNVAHVDKR